ncbi:MAG: ferritin-like domain-containing protein [Trueperaceae bacterium]|nr:ferritin-like domain-containing protein [Trueperaceae bacterium]
MIAQPGEDTDVDAEILNFALNLEYLEAEFYLAAVGRTASYEAEVGGGTVMTNGPVDFTGTPDLEALANEIADHEEAHVVFLRSALGSAAVDRPNLDLRGGVGGAFGTAARAAGSTAGLDAATLDVLETFSPYTNGLFFLHGAFIFEDVGVTAYKGAAPLLANKDTLEAAAGILAVEAYHSGEVRTQLYQERDTVAIPRTRGGAGNVELTVQSIVARSPRSAPRSEAAKISPSWWTVAPTSCPPTRTRSPSAARRPKCWTSCTAAASAAACSSRTASTATSALL